MNQKTNTLILMSTAPALLLLGALFDWLVRALAPDSNAPLGESTRLIFLVPLFELLLMIAVLGVIWALVSAGSYSRGVSVVFLLLGALVLYAVALLTVLPFPDSWYILVLYLSPGSYTFQAGGALAALGLISLWFWKPKNTPVAASAAEPPSDQAF